MKKFVAALLAVLLTAGVCAVSVVAEEPSESTTYKSLDLIFTKLNKYTDKDVTVLKPGDVVSFETRTREIEVKFYADALSIPYSEIVNLKWKAYVDSLGPVTRFAQSPNKYKIFRYYFKYNSPTLVNFTISPLNSEEHKFTAIDGEEFVWGTFPIDYCLKEENGSDAKFLGWIVRNVTNGSSKSTLDLYAYWDRTTSGDTTTETTKPPETTTNPDDANKSDIMKALDKFFNLFSGNNEYDTKDWRYYLTLLPGLPALLLGFIYALLQDSEKIKKVYNFFGIKVD